MFDQNMFNELSKLKVDRRRKVQKQEDIQEEISKPRDDDYYNDYENNEEYQDDEYYEYEDEEEVLNNNLQNITEFINDNLSNKKKLDPTRYINSDPSNDFATSEKEAKLITIAGRKSIRVLKDLEGKEVKSKFIGEDGNLNVVYHEPGKNIVKRKSIEERRLEVKMEALSELISKFKTEDDIIEELKENPLDLDKINLPKKEIKNLENISYIKDGLDIKISLVLNTFSNLSSFIEKKSKFTKNKYKYFSTR
ncbi:MAG: hypothetical protein KatS3mg068_1684 [Candidatus Sericytochromatia bacterium]|nr:MAG: hypothetical protein KatS3mg068_1684 [Candidatus Sericytochromatia bacterium]